ncbi:response regulator transcription factor [Variovorax sp. RB3P1]|uniref:helix-turn-helix transcriptional regulator n=1 Tax=Variovorax sp. RB3P1 TaxID=3443732 RepID=UPI003F47FD08
MIDQMVVLRAKRQSGVGVKTPLSPMMLKLNAVSKRNAVAGREIQLFRAARQAGPANWSIRSNLPPLAGGSDAPNPSARQCLPPLNSNIAGPLARVLGEDVRVANSTATANAMSLLFSEANETTLAFLMRLIAEGDTATALRMARCIVDAASSVVEVEQFLLGPVQVRAQTLTKTNGAHPAPLAGLHSDGGTLSPREINVLRMISQGLSNRKIAESNYRSLHTVDAQVKNIYRKLAVKSRAQAVHYAMQRGFLNANGGD